jgi:hypothetical protein
MGTRDIFDHPGLWSFIQAEGELARCPWSTCSSRFDAWEFGRGMSRDAAFVRVAPSYFPDRRIWKEFCLQPLRLIHQRIF